MNGSAGGRDREPGSVDRGCGRWRGPAPDPGRGACQSGESVKLAGFSAWPEAARAVRVEFVVSDDHAGLKAAIREVLPEAVWQRCYVHFLRNALDYVPRKVDDDCLRELRWFYDRRELSEVRRDIAAWLLKWQAKYPKLCVWVEENIDEASSYYRLSPITST
jgi:Transposase, Mutator family